MSKVQVPIENMPTNHTEAFILSDICNKLIHMQQTIYLLKILKILYIISHNSLTVSDMRFLIIEGHSTISKLDLGRQGQGTGLGAAYPLSPSGAALAFQP